MVRSGIWRSSASGEQYTLNIEVARILKMNMCPHF